MGKIMLDEKKLKILVDGAKYDVSCSSSGSMRKNRKGELGDAHFSGICHSFTEDGRCISLLKILLSNDCCYDCAYCVNRRSNDIPRTCATPDEICELVTGFYKRNYIEGVFLSSAIYKSPTYTMELLLETVKKLRFQYRFNGYIHLKGIPSTDKLLVEQAGFLVDRMSFNIELPSEKSLNLLAPQKNKNAIIEPMKMLAQDRYFSAPLVRKKDFLPAGQTTQMIIGATSECDAHIIKLSEYMYKNYKLKRIYFSSYIPANFSTSLLPHNPTPKIREHRLYQADWLLRYYGFSADEITDDGGNLPLAYDPKCAWALAHLDRFPIEINTATKSELLRVPGIGVKCALRIIAARRYTNLDFDDLKKLRIVLKRAKHFITCKGKFYGNENENAIKLALSDYDETPPAYSQLSMFDGKSDFSSQYFNGKNNNLISFDNKNLTPFNNFYSSNSDLKSNFNFLPALSALNGEL